MDPVKNITSENHNEQKFIMIACIFLLIPFLFALLKGGFTFCMLWGLYNDFKGGREVYCSV